MFPSVEASLPTNDTENLLDRGAETAAEEQQNNAQTSDDDKEKAFELKVINMFYLLDQDCDATLYRDELEPLLKIIEEMKHDQGGSNEGWTEIQQKCDEVNQLDKFELKEFLKSVDENGMPIDDLIRKVYKQKVGCLGRSPCLWVREKMLKYMRGFNRQTPEEIHYGFVSVISDFVAQVIHSLDLISDGNLALQMYIASRTWEEQQRWGQRVEIVNEGKDYSVAFIWIVMAISGPYIIQFSSMINAYFIKDIFDEETWDTYYCVRKVQLFLQLMFTGLAFLPILDLTIKIKATFLAVFIFLFFSKRTKQAYISFRKFTEQIYFKVFKLTFYEVDSFEKQKKHTQLLYEDVPLLVLNALIYFEIFDVPILKEVGIDKKPLIFQFSTTVLSFITTFISLWIESHGLGEDSLEFVMTSVKAKQDFVPHGEKIKSCELVHDLNFSRIEFKIWLISDLFGIYKNFEYQFNEYSIQKLATQILEGQKELKLKKLHQSQVNSEKPSIIMRQYNNSNVEQIFYPKLKFGFSIHHLSVHMFLHFIDRIQSDSPDLISKQIDFDELNMEILIENSIELEHFKYEGTGFCSGQKGKPIASDAKTVGGKRLLQVLIDNEQVDEQGNLISFPLQHLLIMLLQAGWCNPNVLDFNEELTLLSYCHKNKKRNSFDILIKNSSIDPNHQNKDGQNIFGMLFYQCSVDNDFFTKRHLQPREHLNLLLTANQIDDRPKIDIHASCINLFQYGSLKSPIFCYFYRFIKKIKIQDDKVYFDEDHFKSYFGITSEQFQFQKDLEKLEMLPLLLPVQFKQKTDRDTTYQFLQVKGIKVDNIFTETVDLQDNNLLHLSECAFSDQIFHSLTEKYSTFDALKPHLAELIKKKNKFGQTPLDILIKTNTPKFLKIERLLKFDILTKGCLDDREEWFIEYITMKTIREQASIQQLVFANQSLIKKYFNIFKDPRKAYIMQQESFSKRDKLELFQQKFQLPDTDLEHQNLERKMTFKLGSNKLRWQIREGQIIVEDPTKMIINSQVESFTEFNKSIVVKARQSNSGETQQGSKSSNSINKKTKHYLLEASLNWLIDLVSLLDLASDIIILGALLRFNHTSWFSFTIFTMLCPYYAVFTSLMNFQIDRNRRIREDTNTKPIIKIFQRLGTLLFILPTMLLILIMSDFIQTLLTAFVMLPFLFWSCMKGENKIQLFEDFIDYAWHQCIGMNYMDVRGFKSQRTILQLQLESIPQIFFQGYMLLRLNQMGKDQNQVDNIGVSINAIKFSLLMAIIHLVLEFLNLYIEASTWQTGFMDYMIACHNAKINWIAQKTSFIVSSTNSDDGTDQKSRGRYCWCFCRKQAQKKDKNSTVIRFDDKENKFFGNLGFSVSFMFTDLNVESLINIISNLPKVDDYERRTTVELGGCIRELSAIKLLHLLELSHKKVNLKFIEPQIHLKKIFDNDFELKKKLRSENIVTNDEEPILMDMVKKDYHQVVKELINLGANIKLYDNDEKCSTMLSIAYNCRYKETVRVLLNILERDKEDEKTYISQSIRDQQIFYNEIFLRRDEIYCTLYPPLIMQPQFLIAYEMQQSLLYNLPRIIKTKSEEVARDQYDYIWGAYIPEINFEVGNELEQFIPMIEQWQSRYPKQYTVKYCDFQGKFDCRFLSYFAGFRRELYLLNVQEDQSPINKIFQGIIDLEIFKFEIEYLATVQKIILDPNFNEPIDLYNCDLVVNSFGLDKARDIYFKNSRNIAAKHNTNNLIFVESQDYILDAGKGELEYTVPSKVAAIKSAKLFVKKATLSKIRAQASAFKVTEFIYQLGHVYSNLRNEFKVDLPEQVDSINEDQDDEELVCLLDFKFENQYNLDRLAEIKIRNTLLMNIQADNTMKFKVAFDKPLEDLSVHFKLEFEFYQIQEQ